MGMARHPGHRVGDLWCQSSQRHRTGVGRRDQRVPPRGQEGQRRRGAEGTTGKPRTRKRGLEVREPGYVTSRLLRLPQDLVSDSLNKLYGA